MKQLPLETYLLACAQALNLTSAVISVAISAMVGSIVSDDKSMSTIPYGLQFAAVMVFTYPAAKMMGMFGRKMIFFLGSVLLFFAGVVGFIAVEHQNFYLLSAAHVFLGAYISIANYYRFAATDMLNSKDKARAMSIVVAGGVIAAFLGPFMANHLKTIPGFLDFSMCYASFSLIAILTMALIYCWNPKTQSLENSVVNDDLKTSKSSTSHLLIAITASSWGYLAMNLLMIQASLVMQNICTFSQSSAAIQAHVLAMFLPSFFVGYAIAKLGHLIFIMLGFAILSLATVVNIFYFDYNAVYLSLVALGAGWNLMYVGGGALLSKHLVGQDRYRWQGVNDTAIALCATIGAFFPAPLFSWIGWEHTNEWILFFTACVALFCFYMVFRFDNASKREIGT